MKQLAAKTGNENLAPCVPFISAVFNLEQVEGVTAPPDEIAHRPNHRLEVAELMLQVLPDKPEIIHRLTSQPAYAPVVDRITLPHLSQFENADEYYATLFHELTHASGHPRRLNRFAEAEGDKAEKYSFEELVAEFGAAFLCAFSGIKTGECEELQASYIEGWARVFRQDSRILVRAASAAQHATDYIRENRWRPGPNWWQPPELPGLSPWGGLIWTTRFVRPAFLKKCDSPSGRVCFKSIGTVIHQQPVRGQVVVVSF